MLGWLSLGTLTDSGNGVTGSRAWTFSAADNGFDYLADGETLTLTYTVKIDDHHGGVVTQPVTIAITGSNDAPVALADSDQGTIVEAGNDVNDNVLPGVATTSGDVLANDTDVDLTVHPRCRRRRRRHRDRCVVGRRWCWHYRHLRHAIA